MRDQNPLKCTGMHRWFSEAFFLGHKRLAGGFRRVNYFANRASEEVLITKWVTKEIWSRAHMVDNI
jgi:hypothetical protein